MRTRHLATLAITFAGLLTPLARAEEPPGLPPVEANSATNADDPHVWLEEVLGEKALDWVKARNAESHAALAAQPEFAQIESDTLEVLEATDRLVVGERRGPHVYNLWKDAVHRRGLYRRAPWATYVAGAPAWETVLDLDALAAAEGKSWVWKGMALRGPDFTRGLMRLSDGGSDAVVVREFDVTTKSFVEGGFELPEAKGGAQWIDADSVYVSTDFGDGTTTDSGYPRIVKRWRRGTPLAEAEVVFEGKQDAVSVGAYHSEYGDRTVDWVYHNTSFYTSETYVRSGGELVRLPLPDTVEIHTVFEGQVLVEAKRPWTIGTTTHAPGTVLCTSFDDLVAGKPRFSVFFTPDEHTSLQSLGRTRSYLVMQVMQDVRDRLFRCHREGDRWVRVEVPFEGHGRIWTESMDVDDDTFLAGHSSFLRPTTLFHVDVATVRKTTVQSSPERFDPAPYVSEQHFATSKDGTKVPYFLVRRKDLERNGKNRTLLYGYGGFRIALRPWYLGATGKNWLERGGVYVVANIRGGGEYGPSWHEAALKANRHKAYEDFEAIAEDLIAKKITSPKHLGIQGGSNGGLLVGAAYTRRPDLYGAVVCQVPLLDMRRYNKLLAGASWMAEYGNPDLPEEWAFIRTFSPYHLLKKDGTYPRVLFTTSTRDDRVHPGHARKMVARMMEMGHPVLYYENVEGGHAGSANAKQRAYATALVTTYLLHELGE